MHLIQLKAVGSSHKDASETLIPAHALSGPTSLKSWVTEPTPLQVWPFILKGHMTCAHAHDDIIIDVITSQKNVTL